MTPITTKVRCEECEHNLIREQTPDTNRIRCEILENGGSGIMYVEDSTVKCRTFKEADDEQIPREED